MYFVKEIYANTNSADHFDFLFKLVMDLSSISFMHGYSIICLSNVVYWSFMYKWMLNMTEFLKQEDTELLIPFFYNILPFVISSIEFLLDTI